MLNSILDECCHAHSSLDVNCCQDWCCGLAVEALDVGQVDLGDWLTALLFWMTLGLAFGANEDVTPGAVRQMR